jgi:hypothetical protein
MWGRGGAGSKGAFDFQQFISTNDFSQVILVANAICD